MHLKDPTLSAYFDGELSGAEQARVAAHLERCERCREAAARVQADRELLAGVEAQFRQACPAPPSDLLEHLMSAMGQWKQGHPSPVERPDLRSRIAAQIELYFGAAAARSVTGARRSDEEILPAAEALLAAFLGHKAAAAVVGDIVGSVQQEGRLAAGLP